MQLDKSNAENMQPTKKVREKQREKKAKHPTFV
jgi:hypothetical protein